MANRHLYTGFGASVCRSSVFACLSRGEDYADSLILDPTIGSAWWLGQARTDLTNITLKTKAGPIPITFDRDRDGPSCTVTAAIPHDVRVHEAKLGADDLLTMQPASTYFSMRYAPFPIVSIVKGMTFALIRLESTTELSKVAPASKPTAKDFLSLDPGWPSTFIGSYFYVVHEEAGANGTVTISCRMIEGLLEDPATGSAASALTSYLASERYPNDNEVKEIAFQLEQGVDMGRASNIGVRVAVQNGQVQSVYLSGTAVGVMTGQLHIQ